MTAQSQTPNILTAAAGLGLVTIDEMSTVRHLHATSARRLAAGMLADDEIQAFAEHVYTEPYTTRIAQAVNAGRMVGARLSGELIATAGWTPANDTGSVARLIGVFVSPLFAGQGFGRLVVERVEADARQAGFGSFTIRAPLGAAGFFEHLGYEAASHGVWPLTREIALPVAFLRKTDPVAVLPPRKPTPTDD